MAINKKPLPFEEIEKNDNTLDLNQLNNLLDNEIEEENTNQIEFISGIDDIDSNPEYFNNEEYSDTQSEFEFISGIDYMNLNPEGINNFEDICVSENDTDSNAQTDFETEEYSDTQSEKEYAEYFTD